MELPSVSFENAIREAGITKNAIILRNQRWFQDLYINRLDEPPEPNIKMIMEVGKAYSFVYDAKFKDKLNFWDLMPHLMIPLTYFKRKDRKINVVGINFSYIPPKIRMAVLDKIVKTFSSMIIDPNIEMIDKYQFHSLSNMPLFYDIAKNILKGSGFEFAIRSYIYTRISIEPKVITYEDWWKVATFPSKYIKKLGIRAIYYLYKRNIIESYRVGQKEKPPKITKTTEPGLKKLLRERENK